MDRPDYEFAKLRLRELLDQLAGGAIDQEGMEFATAEATLLDAAICVQDRLSPSTHPVVDELMVDTATRFMRLAEAFRHREHRQVVTIEDPPADMVAALRGKDAP
ncbi:MAG: hypothetical protein FD176_2240 [Rhodospirillaceae bacterium]|jgi:hypothetical protein|nr:MAG: hypothetical protein FD176_2240 [Rhodospirillaceae bacterium]TNC95813.1 MAG: hypothetical protein FD119_2188 [Stygiobacter sp.]